MKSKRLMKKMILMKTTVANLDITDMVMVLGGAVGTGDNDAMAIQIDPDKIEFARTNTSSGCVQSVSCTFSRIFTTEERNRLEC